MGAHVITSLLDTDLYKFTMQQVVLHHYPSARVAYKFKCRNEGVDLAQHKSAIEAEIDHLCTLSFSDSELGYLASLRYMKSSYVDFLRGFKLNRDHVQVQARPTGEIDIHVAGPWFHTILFEVPILSIVNEIYYAPQSTPERLRKGRQRLDAKSAELLSYQSGPGCEGFKFSDFGTRRRFSRSWQREVVESLAAQHPDKFTGTSNVLLAKELGITPIGTMAHEYLQAFQALGPNLRSFQKAAFETWAQEYRGDLGIALSDIVGVDAFLKDFDLYFCKLFDGVRHDSGDPFAWGEKIIAHYESHRIDPKTKTMVFSDGLDIPLAIRLHRAFSGRGRPAFGIGTNLTNDLGLKALNIVMKMVSCNGQPVAKISDSPGKAMCDDGWYLQNLAKTFALPLGAVELSADPIGPRAPKAPF